MFYLAGCEAGFSLAEYEHSSHAVQEVKGASEGATVANKPKVYPKKTPNTSHSELFNFLPREAA